MFKKKKDPQRKAVEAETRAHLSRAGEEGSKTLIEAAINATYPGLTVFVRDTNLSEEQIQTYYPKQIILEKSYAEGSHFGKGGVPTNCRYTILSSHMTPADEMIEEAAKNGNTSLEKCWPKGHGICFCQRNSHFKVLDIYQYKGKTQITLLHLPDYELWKVFTVVDTLFDDGKNPGFDTEMIQNVRKMFEERCLLPPDPRISSPEFLERWNFPLGMTDDGELFDITLEVPDYNPSREESK